jgi:hypothetical protein
MRKSFFKFYFLLLLIFVSFFLSINNFKPKTPELDFLVGVEYAINNYSVEECKALVDRVKNFTNLFVVDSFGITSDIIKLNEVCDYVFDSGLKFLVFFISPIGSDLKLRYNFYPHIWISEAKEKYGDKFLGVYAMDEPGGSLLDQGDFRMFNKEDVENASQAYELYVENLFAHIEYYTDIKRYEDITVLTADYGLYWFNYEAGYDTILTEFGWNHSRQLHIALCRGAATVLNRDWGIIETWTYDNAPYLTSAENLFDDLVLAYRNGAKYAVIFNHPDTSFSDYGILTEEHFDILEVFWNYIKDNPNEYGIEAAKVAYILPENFGYGFRNNNDKIWGLEIDEFTEDQWGDWNSTVLTKKVWNDINHLLLKYGSRLDIIYSNYLSKIDLQKKYETLFLWNQTIH